MRIVITTSNLEPLLQPLESAQSLSIKDTERRADAGIDPSVGSVGDSCDDALAKSIIGLLKTEAINVPGPQKGAWKSLGHVEWETLNWVSWYNCERLHGAIGYITPHEARKAFHANMNALHEVARPLNKTPPENPGRFKPQP